MKHKIKQYKGVDLFYDEDRGNINFEFEGTEQSVKYVFEAEQIIDTPVWEKCDLSGYYINICIDAYIGLARATRKDIKSGKPDWLIKGQYDIEYKRTNWNDQPKIFPKTKENNEVYNQWENQRNVYHQELNKLNTIATRLKGE